MGFWMLLVLSMLLLLLLLILNVVVNAHISVVRWAIEVTGEKIPHSQHPRMKQLLIVLIVGGFGEVTDNNRYYDGGQRSDHAVIHIAYTKYQFRPGSVFEWCGCRLWYSHVAYIFVVVLYIFVCDGIYWSGKKQKEKSSNISEMYEMIRKVKICFIREFLTFWYENIISYFSWLGGW